VATLWLWPAVAMPLDGILPSLRVWRQQATKWLMSHLSYPANGFISAERPQLAAKPRRILLSTILGGVITRLLPGKRLRWKRG